MTEVVESLELLFELNELVHGCQFIEKSFIEENNVLCCVTCNEGLMLREIY